MKLERLTDRAREVLVGAQAAAKHCRHATVEAPHLLLGILRRPDSKGGAALDQAGLKYRDVLVEVQGMYEQAPEASAELLALSTEAEALLDGALREAVGQGQEFVETVHLALACSQPVGSPSIEPFVTGRERAIRAAALQAVRWSAGVEAQQRAQRREPHLRLDALNRANDVRMLRAQLKRDLIRGRVSMRSILLDPPESVQTAGVYDMLLAIPRCGRVRATKLLAQCAIPTNTTVGELSQRQRDCLINHL